MESQPSQPPTPNAKPGTAPVAATTAAAVRPAARTYPKPPSLFMRLALLCLRPESWAETARYPTRITLVPLFLAVLLGALAIGVGETWQNYQGLHAFAAGYDTHGYPPLQLNSDGTLSTKGTLENPIRVTLPNTVIFVDPTGKTAPDSIKTAALFITGKDVAFVGPDGPLFSMGLPAVLPAYGIQPPAPGQTKTVSTETMVGFLNRHQIGFMALGSAGVFLVQAIGETIWVLVMLFMLRPLIILAAAGPRGNPEAPDRRLILPKRAAYRMAAGVLVPLMVLSALLRAIGHPVYGLLGPQGAMVFWLMAAVALAAWTGVMAKKMYGMKERGRANG